MNITQSQIDKVKSYVNSVSAGISIDEFLGGLQDALKEESANPLPETKAQKIQNIQALSAKSTTKSIREQINKLQ